MKEYKKAEVVAKNAPSGSYAAGCPTNGYGDSTICRICERAK